MAFTGRIRDHPLFLFPHNAAFPDANSYRSDSFNVAVTGVYRH
jgi:hypothetical protein